MDDALQMHLYFNHVGLLGGLAALLVVLVGMVMRNTAVRMVGLGVYVVMAITIIPTYLSGEGAEERVEHKVGVTEDVIHEHEEHAEVALWLMLGAGLLAVAAMAAQWKSSNTSLHTIATIAFVALAVAAFIKVGITAHEGGKIQRPELQESTGSR